MCFISFLSRDQLLEPPSPHGAYSSTLVSFFSFSNSSCSLWCILPSSMTLSSQHFRQTHICLLCGNSLTSPHHISAQYKLLKYPWFYLNSNLLKNKWHFFFRYCLLPLKESIKLETSPLASSTQPRCSLWACQTLSAQDRFVTWNQINKYAASFIFIALRMQSMHSPSVIE